MQIGSRGGYIDRKKSFSAKLFYNVHAHASKHHYAVEVENDKFFQIWAFS